MSVVFFTNTNIEKRAMMIKFLNAILAFFAVITINMHVFLTNIAKHK